jgi:tetratricopeptide (TPR) repeat protein
MTQNLGSPAGAQARSKLQNAEQLLRAGRFAEAQKACRDLLAFDPRNAPALLMLGLALARTNQLDEAETALDKCISINPRLVSAHTNLGNLFLLKADPTAAVRCYRQALSMSPEHQESLFNLSLAQKALGRYAEASDALHKLLDIAPRHVDAHVQLGVVLLALNEPEKALAAFDGALALREATFEAHFNRGTALVRLGRLEEAKLALARAASMNERNPQVFLALGQTLHRLQERALATSALARAVVLDPDNADAHAALGAVFLEDGWTIAALDEVRKTLSLDANHSYGHIIHGRALTELNRLDEALAANQAAVSVAPDSVEALMNLGLSYLGLGREDETRAAFMQALALSPNDVRVHMNLSRTERIRPGDDRFKELEGFLSEPSRILPNERVELCFTLGRILDQAGQHNRAFEYFAMANRLQGEQKVSKEEENIALLARIKEVFSREFIAARKGVGNPSQLPIFVLGMPRSGTTLCEQVISSHPAVAGAGEVVDLGSSIKILCTRKKITTPMPGLVLELSNEDLRELGEIYVSRLSQRAPGYQYVTDKLPGNYNRVGLIHLALPNAKIIHCTRNPIDSCFSIYSNHFAEHLEHANDLSQLGRFYRRYHDLMEHWRSVLPPDRFLDVRYEDTVGDLEATARRIIAYCGLEWDARCLDFRNNSRSVATLSITQVRQPIYRSSVDRWRNYESELEPLRVALGDLAPSSEPESGS